ncbi:MAG: hypothetical protein ACR2I0_01780 [Rhodoferax sp.]
MTTPLLDATTSAFTSEQWDLIHSMPTHDLKFMLAMQKREIDRLNASLESIEFTFDRAFLDWCADRMVYVYGADPQVDFVLKLRRMAGSRI